MKPLLDALYAPQYWFTHLSPYIWLTIEGLAVTAILGCAGFILARMGYKPLWALVLIVPVLNVIGVWILAYRKFPREKIS